jgi:N-acetylglucosaminyl-diphospho-decaprenol L-rhamnosyltransferase
VGKDSPSERRTVRVITVSYHSESVLPEMLHTVPNDVEVVVVDNSGFTSEAMQSLKDEFSFKYLLMEKNRGFGAACNEGARGATTDFLFFLNPDAQLTPRSLESLVEALSIHPEASAANPLIQGNRGKSEFKYRSVLLPRQKWRAREIPSAMCDMPALTGSALLVRRNAFNRVSGFDEKIFLYHEDDDLSIRLRREVGPLLFFPQSVVKHQAGNSTERTADLAFNKAFHKAQSRVYAMRKHKISRGFLKTFISATLGLFNPTTLLLRRKRLQAWGFFMGTLKAKNS